MKRFILFIFLFLTACDSPNSGPRGAVDAYLKSLYNGDLDKAYELLSASDQKTVSLAEFQEKNQIRTAILSSSSQASFKIISVQTLDKSATVSVSETTPDLTVLISAAFLKAFDSDENDGQSLENIKEKLEKGALPTVTKETDYELIKEDGVWRVFFNWEAGQQIESLKAEADQLRKEKKLKAAVSKYEEILELDSQEVEAQEQLQETKTEIKNFETKKAYIDQIKILDFVARKIDTYSEKNVPAVRFRLRNEGDKSLSKVEVTVYFRDRDGNVIFEEDFIPVLISSYSFSGDNKPLKPGYYWQLEEDKYYTIKNAPREWEEGNAYAKVTDFEFE